MKHVHAAVLALLLAGGPTVAVAQTNQPPRPRTPYPSGMTQDQILQLYADVLTGKRSFSSLTPNEKAIIEVMLRAQQHPTSQKCEAVADAYDELLNATSSLVNCAKARDYGDSCDTQFSDVRDAHDNLESAVSDADDDCE